MWDRLIGFLMGLSEAGKTVSAKNAAKLKAIHDHSAAMLSMECAPGLTEASRARLEEAARSYSDTERVLRDALQGSISLAEELGATVVRVKADKPGDGLIAFAKREGITHVVFGQTARTRWEILMKGSTLNRFLQEVGGAAVQVVPLGDDRT